MSFCSNFKRKYYMCKSVFVKYVAEDANLHGKAGSPLD